MTSDKKPAIQAFFHQLIGFTFTIVAILIGNVMFNSPSTVMTLLFGTGTLAAFLSWRSRQAVWWVPIHLLFPLAVLIAIYANLSPWWYLAGFVICVGLFGSIYKTRVPYYPSRKKIWTTLSQIPQLQKESLRIIDIGCGMGGCAIHIQNANKHWKVTGIELALIPLLICKLRSLGKKISPLWLLGDYHKLNFENYDVVFAYLSPAAMLDLEDKMEKDMHPGSWLISLEFKLPNRDVTEEIPTSAGTLYLYLKT